MPPSGPRPSGLVPDRTEDLVHVAAAALVDSSGRVLLARRADDAHQGGLWEFPGGKLETGESVADGLRRELHEELGIEITGYRPLIKITHHYDDRSVVLDVHLVSAWRGTLHGREGQPLAWVERGALQDYPMPPADVPIVRALQLPDRYVITPPQIDDPDALLRGLERTLAGGASLLQLRLFDIAEAAFVSLARTFCERCHAQGAKVLLNGSAAMLQRVGADGLHLNSRQLHQLDTRPVGPGLLLAASCHAPRDLLKARRLGADFAMLSPVLPTRSHPDAEPLGWDTFALWVAESGVPVYALGGMRPELLETAWAHGAQGVAGIRGLWHDDPAG